MRFKCISDALQRCWNVLMRSWKRFKCVSCSLGQGYFVLVSECKDFRIHCYVSLLPSEHETHLKRFNLRIKAFQHFWCASEMHLKRISRNLWNKVNNGIIDAFLMRIWNAFRYAHHFRILNAHCIRISDAYLMRIRIASIYINLY